MADAPVFDKARLTAATSAIEYVRSTQRGTEGEIFKAAMVLMSAHFPPFENWDEYWRLEMGYPSMKVTEFIRLLATNLSDPADFVFNGQTAAQVHIKTALDNALRINASWFIRTPENDPTGYLRPREAAQWLAGIPPYRNLVPSTLRAFLDASEQLNERGVPASETPSSKPRKSSRTPEERLSEWMLGWLKTVRNPTQRAAWKAAREKFGDKVTRNQVVKMLHRLCPEQHKTGPRGPRK